MAQVFGGTVRATMGLSGLSNQANNSPLQQSPRNAEQLPNEVDEGHNPPGRSPRVSPLGEMKGSNTKEPLCIYPAFQWTQKKGRTQEL